MEFTKFAALTLLFLALWSGPLSAASYNRQILFKLAAAPGSEEEKTFIEKTKALAQIPGVEEIRLYKLEGKKQTLTHGLVIVFASQTDTKPYVAHPLHKQYLAEVWKSQVSDATITDYIEIGRSKK